MENKIICRWRGCYKIVPKKHHSPYCPKHRHKQFKLKHPLTYFWCLLRGRAKERGIEFSLSLNEYKQFCELTDYDKLKGKTSLSLSIDRINNEKGYSFDNIRAITLSENDRRLFSNIPSWMKEEIRLALNAKRLIQ